MPSYRFLCVTSTSAGSDVGIDRKPVILRRDFNLAGRQLLHRVVRAAMAEFQLVGLAAHRQAQDLMTEADAEHRHTRRDERFRVVDRIGERRRVAGTVAQEHAVGIGCESSAAGVLAG